MGSLMAEKMNDDELKALVASEISSSITYDQSELSKKRADALEYYQGTMRDLPAMPGRSSITSRDTSDTIGWMLPSIIRVFTASDHMAVFEPERPEDEAAAAQATDYCNFVFWKDNPGYQVLYNTTHDSLLHGNGVGKVWWDDAEECEYSEHTRLTAEQIAILTNDEGVEVLTAEQNDEPDMVEQMDPATGQPVQVPVPTFDIKIKREKYRGRVRIESIPPENFLMDKDAVSIADARFTAHRDTVTRSELIRMGFPKEKVEELPSDGLNDWQEESLARDEDRVDFEGNVSRSEEQVELFECYIKADADGDGESEYLRIWYAGNAGGGEILEWDTVDGENPFFDLPCEPVPHRWDARSIYDETADIQKVKTALIRQTLDNMYASNLPQPIVPAGAVKNMDTLVNPQFGAPIIVDPTKAPNGIGWNVVPFVADKALTAIQFFDGVIEKRTGVSRTMMALDPEALQNQTATANQNARDAAYSQIELIARNHAEYGWKVMFRKLLKLVIRHQDRPRVIRLRNEWVEIDPRDWNASMDVNVNVGLGTGSRDRDMAMLNTVLANQIGLTERLMAVMPAKAAEMLPKIIATMKKIAESAGMRDVDQFYPDVSMQELQGMLQQAQAAKSQPDPKIAMEMEKAKADMAIKQQELQFKGQEMAMNAEIRREQLAMEMQLKREQLAAELELKREQMAAELSLKREMGYFNGAVKGAMSSDVRMGGEPG